LRPGAPKPRKDCFASRKKESFLTNGNAIQTQIAVFGEGLRDEQPVNLVKR
jgi:hypothetical protein